VPIGFVTTDQGTAGIPGYEQGAKAAVAYANAALGGIDGHPISLDYCSVGSDAQTNQQCGQHFANSKDKLVVVGQLANGGPFYTAVGNSIPVIGTTPLTTADFATSVVQNWTPGQLIQGGMVNLVGVADPNAKTVGVVDLTGPIGDASIKLMNAANKDGKYKFKVVDVAEDATDLLGPISSLGKVDAYVVNLAPTGCIQAALAISQTHPGAPVVSQQGCSEVDNESVTKGTMSGWYIANINKITVIPNPQSDPDVETFTTMYPKYGPTADTGNSFTSAAWGMILTVRKVLSGAGYANLTSSGVHQALAQFSGPVILGPNAIHCPGTPYADTCANTIYGYQILKDGQLQPLSGNEFEIPVG
jgi:branched-chain amino acid transport system substrate-binding protein